VLHIRKPTVPDAEQARVYRKLGIDWKAEVPPMKRFVKGCADDFVVPFGEESPFHGGSSPLIRNLG